MSTSEFYRYSDITDIAGLILKRPVAVHSSLIKFEDGTEYYTSSIIEEDVPGLGTNLAASGNTQYESMVQLRGLIVRARAKFFDDVDKAEKARDTYLSIFPVDS